MNYVKNDIKNIIEGILSRYDNIVYYHKYKKFYKGHYGVLENISDYIKDKVNLAIACFSKSISNYNVSGTINGIPHSIWLENVVKGKLRRTKRNRVK